MKRVQNYILSQTAQKNLAKEDALPMLKELFENQSNTVKTDDIAIIGMACRFPEADDIDEFWSNMVNGVDSVRDFPESRKKDVDRPIRDYFKGKRNAPEINYRRGAYLDRIDRFDADYFNITPAEARCMDPLQRIFLEVTWEAMEDAGYTEKELYGSRTGIYVGDTDADYLDLIQNMEPYALPGNTISVIASRIAYMLNLSSGSHLIDTACSASLAAVHHAVKGLMTGDCEMAMAGGLNLTLFPVDEGLVDIGIASPDSIARTFDSSANGTVWGEGCGVIVLKTLEQAKKDRDYIHAVIKGSAMNSDGRSNGITAPSAKAQTELIKAAWQNAGISPETVSYIEAHGTGTKLGDPIEIEGIANAFQHFTDKRQFCALGAVKTNIGHQDTAAGIAGLIKTVLLLKHKEIPATLHFHEPNPHINFVDSPVYLNTERRPWETEGGALRRAGVSAFGIAGTNCHVILEEYNESNEKQFPGHWEREQYIFTLSAKSKASFDQLVKRYSRFLPHTSHSLPDICFTSNLGREHYAYRLALPVSSLEQLQERLERFRILGEEASSNEQGIYYRYVPQRREQKNFSIGDQTGLETILEEYMNGCEINWEAMYDQNARRRVPLPVYPFSGKRHWIDYIPEHEDSPVKLSHSPMHMNQQEDIDRWFYTLNWVDKPLQPGDDLPTKKETWLILADEEHVAASLRELMSKDGAASIFVEASERYSKIDSGHYELRPSVKEDYLRLVASLVEEGIAELSGVVHMWTCTEIRNSLRSLEDVNKSQEKGVLSLLLLLHALKEFESNPSLEIKVVSNYANLVVPEDTYIFPEKASLWGLMKVVDQEFTSYRCSCMDIETIDREPSEVAVEIYQELTNSEAPKDHVSAWRDGNRYTQQLERMNLADLPRQKIHVQEGGVYLIAGGAGAVGLEVCKYLARKERVKLVVVNRTLLPKRSHWEEAVNETNHRTVTKRIRDLLDIETLGSEVIYYAADITNPIEMKKVINDVTDRYSQINGVINATMHLEEERIDQQEVDAFIRTMESKIMGTWTLNEITKDQQLDFFLLFSSVASFLGGKGLGSYAAANAFMDRYAQYQRRRGVEIRSINWSYLEMGASDKQMADDHALSVPISSEEYGQILNRMLEFHFTQTVIANIKSEELAKVLTLLNINFSHELTAELNSSENQGINPAQANRILEAYRELEQIIHSNETLFDFIQRDVELGEKFVSFEEELYRLLDVPQESSVEMGHEKQPIIEVSMVGGDSGEHTETERKLGQIWGGVLGQEEINVHADFFENGDSLMLMSVLSRIKEQFDIDVPVEVVFQEPTIFGLSRWIDQENDELLESDDIPILPRQFSDSES